MNAYERLLDVALELFVDRGYDAVGTQEIVDRAGVTKPTLYHHFGNKLGIARALAERIESSLFETLGDRTAYKRDMPLDLERLIEGILHYAESHPRETQLLVGATNGPGKSESRQAMLVVWSRLTGEVERFFLSAAADHGNMAGREREYTVSFLGIVFAYAGLIMDGTSLDRASLAYRITHQFSHGIYS